MSRLSPYLRPGFYDEALANGRHRDIVGGRWEETGIIQMEMLDALGLRPDDNFLDIGAGSLRLGCRLVPFLDKGRYWGTDASRALMLRGHEVELEDRSRLDPAQLIEDSDFGFPGVPHDIDVALAFGVFTHLPLSELARALPRVRQHFPAIRQFLFTVFIAPDDVSDGPYRQVDGVVTHPDRTPFHHRAKAVRDLGQTFGFDIDIRNYRLPRGQVLCVAEPDDRPPA